MTELETMQRAKMYMDKLAQGIDPISGQELPEDSALNNVRLARCFFYVSGILEKVIQNDGHIGAKPRINRADFVITPPQLAAVILPSQPLRISEFADLLHQAAGGDPEMRKPNTTMLTDWLLSKNFLEKVPGNDGKAQRLPTPAGNALGISIQIRQGQYGEYRAVYYDQNAMRFLLDNLPGILAEKGANRE